MWSRKWMERRERNGERKEQKEVEELKYKEVLVEGEKQWEIQREEEQKSRRRSRS